MALAIVLAGQQPVPIGRSCALTFDQPQSLSVTETLVRRVPYRRLFILVLRALFESRRTRIRQLWRLQVPERPGSIRLLPRACLPEAV